MSMMVGLERDESSIEQTTPGAHLENSCRTAHYGFWEQYKTKGHRMYTVEITPVDLTQSVDLPHPWPQLQAQNFHGDLTELAQRYLLQADRLGFAELGREVLRQLGAGFLTPFDRKHFEHLIGGPYASMQSKVLAVLEGLSQ